jgi:uncharacterized Zn finger protein
MPSTPLRSLLGETRIDRLATPANRAYGTQIAARHGVEIIEESATRVEAWVGGLDGTVKEGGGQRRRTQLFVEDGALAWHCAGNPRNHDIFCKHCVALMLVLLQADGNGSSLS